VDVVKGVEMFESLKVPTVSIVENMSFYRVKDEKHYIFGEGFTDQL
jgi:Mrp family chromosome partitioning ATPase